MDIKDSICVCGSNEESNADKLCFTRDIILIFDGAAPLNKEAFLGSENSAVWFINKFRSFFLDIYHLYSTTIEALESARIKTYKEYLEIRAKIPETQIEEPFSCLSVIREHTDYVELINMGDCSSLFKIGNQINCFGNSAVKRLDAELKAFLPDNTKEGRIKLTDAVAKNRSLRNKIFGYDVLAPSTPLLGRCERIILEKNNGIEILLMTDGFYRIVDTFKLYSNATLLLAVKNFGLQSILNEIRDIEISDQECIKFPRVKIHDDASAVYCRIRA